MEFCGTVPRPSALRVDPRLRCDQRQRQSVHPHRAGPFQSPGAGADGRSGRDHVVDQQDTSASDGRSAVRRHGKSSGHVTPPLNIGQADLARRGSWARKRERVASDAGQPLEFGGEQGCLVEAAAQQPPTMERHRHDQIASLQQVLARITEPSREQPPRIVAVAVFQPMDQIADHAIEMSHRPGAIVDGWIGERPRRDDWSSCVEGQRKPEPITQRRANEFDAAPASGAQRVVDGERLAAGETERRHDEIGDPARASRNHLSCHLHGAQTRRGLPLHRYRHSPSLAREGGQVGGENPPRKAPRCIEA